jgi:small subunit ribosomal protein S19e
MTTIYDVPADLLIKRIAEDLKQKPECAPPEWAPFVKTAVYKEKAPADPEWWHVRQAAILRKIYIQGPIGIERLRGLFSGPKNRGSKPNKTFPSSGSIVRKAIQQLEALEYVKAVKGKGREITPKGRKLMDNNAHLVIQEIITTHPELGKY